MESWVKLNTGVIDLIAAGGWAAPSEAVMDLFDPVGMRHWPPGLLPEDLDWLAQALVDGELDPEPYHLALDTTPLLQLQRGGIRFPVPGADDGAA